MEKSFAQNDRLKPNSNVGGKFSEKAKGICELNTTREVEFTIGNVIVSTVKMIIYNNLASRKSMHGTVGEIDSGGKYRSGVFIAALLVQGLRINKVARVSLSGESET